MVARAALRVVLLPILAVMSLVVAVRATDCLEGSVMQTYRVDIKYTDGPDDPGSLDDRRETLLTTLAAALGWTPFSLAQGDSVFFGDGFIRLTTVDCDDTATVDNYAALANATHVANWLAAMRAAWPDAPVTLAVDTDASASTSFELDACEAQTSMHTGQWCSCSTDTCRVMETCTDDSSCACPAPLEGGIRMTVVVGNGPQIDGTAAQAKTAASRFNLLFNGIVNTYSDPTITVSGDSLDIAASFQGCRLGYLGAPSLFDELTDQTLNQAAFIAALAQDWSLGVGHGMTVESVSFKDDDSTPSGTGTTSAVFAFAVAAAGLIATVLRDNDVTAPLSW